MKFTSVIAAFAWAASVSASPIAAPEAEIVARDDGVFEINAAEVEKRQSTWSVTPYSGTSCSGGPGTGWAGTSSSSCVDVTGKFGGNHAASALFEPRGCTIRFYIDQTCGRQIDTRTGNGFTCKVIGSGAFRSFRVNC